MSFKLRYKVTNIQMYLPHCTESCSQLSKKVTVKQNMYHMTNWILSEWKRQMKRIHFLLNDLFSLLISSRWF